MLLELKTFLIAMTPFGELRASIPIALGVYGLPLWSAFIFSVLGNIVPALFWLWSLGKISRYLSHKFYFFNRFFTWLFERTRNNHNSKFAKWKEFTLVLLVAIPFPLTGVWTGSLVSFVFSIPFKKAFPLIFLGVIIAGVIVTFVTLGVLKII